MLEFKLRFLNLLQKELSEKGYKDIAEKTRVSSGIKGETLEKVIENKIRTVEKYFNNLKESAENLQTFNHDIEKFFKSGDLKIPLSNIKVDSYERSHKAFTLEEAKQALDDVIEASKKVLTIIDLYNEKKEI